MIRTAALSALALAFGAGAGAQDSDFDARRADWRTGAVTYQIFVDRFAPSRRLEEKAEHYAPPRSLQDWSAQPAQGEPAPGTGVWTHELAFWGGDLESVAGRAGYLRDLGVDVIYLNPIHLAPTNHKYDAVDLTRISPEYGDEDDLRRLADTLHDRGMRLVLDGVFNHVGSRSTWFLDAQASEDSPYRDWFHFDETVQNGYVGWWGVRNLPELNWNNPEVRDAIVNDSASVVRKWFEYGIDGWRLDVATELGVDNLRLITSASHQESPGSLVIGEVWSYPAEWGEALDAVMNFPLRALMFAYVDGEIGPDQFGGALDHMIDDAGIEPLLRSWVLLDNHDTPRLATLYPNTDERALLQMLQFTLPGAPLVYYGVEAGLEGGQDPGGRGPMDWEAAQAGQPEFDRLARLIALREASPALRVGDFIPLAASESFAFMRLTDRSAETVVVIVNAGEAAVEERVMLRDWRIMSGERWVDALTGARFDSNSALLSATVPPRSALILRPERWAEHTERTGHSPYRHIP